MMYILVEVYLPVCAALLAGQHCAVKPAELLQLDEAREEVKTPFGTLEKNLWPVLEHKSFIIIAVLCTQSR